MQTEFNPKTNELTIKLSVNPKSTQPSSTGKTVILGTDGGKIDLDGTEARVQVNVTRPIEGGKKKGK